MAFPDCHNRTQGNRNMVWCYRAQSGGWSVSLLGLLLSCISFFICVSPSYSMDIKQKNLSSDGPARISPYQRYQLTRHGGLRVLDLSAKVLRTQMSVDTGSVKASSHAQLTDGFADQAAAVSAGTPILITTDAGEGYYFVAEAVKQLGLEHTYFLQGGRKAWRDYLALNRSIQNRPRKRIGEALTCGPR